MVDTFLLKKLVSVFTQIIPGGLIILLLALILQSRWPRVGRGVAIGTCCLLLLGSMPPVSNFFISRLETQFPVLKEAPADTVMILVLGSGHLYKQDRPANSILTATALSRLTEGVRLWNSQPESYLLLSGAKFKSEISHASALRRMAIEMGVPNEKIRLLEQTRDTEEEIVAALKMVDEFLSSGAVRMSDETVAARLVVTSSATHLPRAAKILEDRRAVYSMAPTDFAIANVSWYRSHSSFLSNIDRALHERVGMAWYQLRRWLVRQRETRSHATASYIVQAIL